MDKILVNMLRLMPLRSYTHMVRLAARIPVPRSLRPLIFGRLAWI